MRGSCSKGVVRLNPYASAANCNMWMRFCDAEPGPRAPSSSGFDQSEMTLAGSKSYLLPSPLHSGQAPYMLLNENERGSSTGTLMPHSGHASFDEYRCSSPPTTATCTSPLASFMANSTDCARRCSIPGFTSNRSTTSSMVWFLRLSSVISSSAILRSSPSMRARVKPCCANLSSSFLNSPLRPRTMGAMIITRSSGFRSITRCPIWSADCREMARPHCGQCGTPIDEYSRRK